MVHFEVESPGFPLQVNLYTRVLQQYLVCKGLIELDHSLILMSLLNIFNDLQQVKRRGDADFIVHQVRVEHRQSRIPP